MLSRKASLGHSRSLEEMLLTASHFPKVPADTPGAPIMIMAILMLITALISRVSVLCPAQC